MITIPLITQRVHFVGSLTALLVLIPSWNNHFVLAEAAPRPNIVLFLADDLGWADVGFHDSEIRTPVIDSLAKQGVVLDSFYVQPSCTPTRIALMTGRYPYHCGGQVRVLRRHHKHGAAPKDEFLSQALQDAGYKTAITGKWHLGLARRAFWPAQRGFDLQYGHLGGAIDYFEHTGYGSLDWYSNDQIPLHEEGYATDLIGQRAVDIVSEHPFDQQPLFLYVPFNAPHTPLHAKKADIKAYASIKNKKRRAYAAMVTALDRQIGAVMSALEERGVSDQTLVMFASDNGGATGSANNEPLRGHKGTLFEGGVRVPAVVACPDLLPSGTTVSSPIHIVDLFPTFLGLAGGKTKSDTQLDGIDVWSAIANDKPLPVRDIILNVFDENGRGAIRRGDWKLIAEKKPNVQEGVPLGDTDLLAQLYNISEDPNEQNDLAATRPDLVQDLWHELQVHGAKVGDTRPYSEPEPPGWKPPADWSRAPE